MKIVLDPGDVDNKEEWIQSFALCSLAAMPDELKMLSRPDTDSDEGACNQSLKSVCSLRLSIPDLCKSWLLLFPGHTHKKEPPPPEILPEDTRTFDDWGRCVLRLPALSSVRLPAAVKAVLLGFC